MGKIRKAITAYWLPLTLGLFLTAAAIQGMVQVRGGFEVGGECLITPFLCAAHYALREAIKARKRRDKRGRGIQKSK